MALTVLQKIYVHACVLHVKNSVLPEDLDVSHLLLDPRAQRSARHMLWAQKEFLNRQVIFIYSVQGDNHHVPAFLLSHSKLLPSHTNKVAQKVN